MKAVEAGDPEAIAEYERKLALQRERNHRRQQKIKEAREADPAYIAQMEEKERLQRESYWKRNANGQNEPTGKRNFPERS